MIPDNERLATLESEMRQVLEVQREFRSDVKDINGKLDELLGLRNKGAGIFWLMTTLAGTGILTMVYQFLDWFKNG